MLALALMAVLNGFAWGQKGHDVVAYIAENHLTEQAAQRVAEVLGGRSMVYYANWMDNASNTPEYAYSKTWHYMNIDEGETFESQPRNDKGDIITAINAIVKNIEKGKLSPEEEKDQLRMLIHMVGDMHCPMHAGHKSDRGGNGTKVKYFGEQKKLHSVWDSEIVESAHRWSHTEWAVQIDRLRPKAKRAIMLGTPNDWIEESVALADRIYDASTSNSNLSYDYVAEFAPIVELQLLRGGLRLAAILEQLY